MTREEISYSAQNMKALIRPELVRIAEIRGEPVAIIVALPDLNEALKGLNGCLLPFGWLRLLWRLKVKRPRKARVLLMGVRPQYQRGFLGGALSSMLMVELHKALRHAKYEAAELSWVLEDNTPMIRLLEGSGAKVYKRYRIYEKVLS